ncbi:unnamed protein product [Adineta ricciae]|uniref:SHSP domain-containing protein n=1 Tax=Adineta ricciae TaxID=249248 RepID=A0A814G0G8_ADIRI|nr:unnamed protein product [Adineta ricciae]
MALCQLVAYSICDNPCVKLDFFDPADCVNIIPQTICFRTNILQCKSMKPPTGAAAAKTATNYEKSVKSGATPVSSPPSPTTIASIPPQSKAGSMISAATNLTKKSSKTATTTTTKTKTIGADKFCIHLSVDGFDRETIKAKVEGGKIVVEANQEDRQDDGDFYIRQFRKSYEVPKQADITKVNSHVTLDNVLVVEVPLRTQVESSKLQSSGQSVRSSRRSLSTVKKSRSQERNSSIQTSDSAGESFNKFSGRSRSVKPPSIASQGQQTKTQSMNYGEAC